MRTENENASKTEVIGARTHLALATCAHQVSRAILIGTEKRPAALHALGRVGLVRIVGGWRPGWIVGNRVLMHVERVVWPIPVAHPLPYVSGDVDQSVAVRRKLSYGRDPREPVAARVVVGEVAVMNVGHLPSTRAELITPGIEF